MSMETSYSIIGFYIIFMVILNFVSIGYGESFIKNADFLKDDIKTDFSGDIFNTLNFLLFVEVPTTSNIANALGIYRSIYWLVVVPYTVLIAIIILKLITFQGG